MNKDRISFLLFAGAILCFSFICGGIVVKYKVFPHRLYKLAKAGFNGLFFTGQNKHGGWIFRSAIYPDRPAIYNSSQACEGVNLVVSFTSHKEISAAIMDLDGKVIHRWILDWFKIWPDAKHVPERFRPKSRPGTLVHGIVMMENGDLIFNFEALGLVRIDMQGKVIWRLPYKTHHSVVKDDDGNLWVCGFKGHAKRDDRFPGILPPFVEETILIVSPEGRIIKAWSVPELLRENGLTGLIYIPYGKAVSPHLNDAEPFPAALQEGFFKRGDVLVSLRDINTVFVFNKDTQKITFITTGKFVRQHDPDFIDGNSFSVFDNNSTYILPKDGNYQSRIVIVSAPENTVKVFFEGSPKAPFFSEYYGKHMWLPNGDLLITETGQGRAFEIDRQGEIVWEYINYVDDRKIGTVTEVQRLPSEYKRLFLH